MALKRFLEPFYLLSKATGYTIASCINYFQSQRVGSLHHVRVFKVVTAISILTSCEGFLEVEVPNSKIPNDVVFNDDLVATSAVVGMYSNLYVLSGFAGGGESSVAVLAGLSSDELVNNAIDEPFYVEFESNEIAPTNTKLLALWNSLYKSVYEANSILEGLSQSTKLTPSLKMQLTGEALFVRAFCYFYLVNLFGDIPLAISTDYQVNSRISRSPAANVYSQMTQDLTEAEEMLSETYVAEERIRVNRAAASALLSRVYLFSNDWARAEDKATNVISNSNLFALADSLNDVFLAKSQEAIFQLKPADGAAYTSEGYYFGILEGPKHNILNPEILNQFEAGDRRKKRWINIVTYKGLVISLPYKYKRYLLGSSTNEYSMIIRLAEVYLIRAEARTMQDKITDAVSDLDKIRKRAGLLPINEIYPSITKVDLLAAIEDEKRSEFFSEWGHRWLDLKRSGNASNVLSITKPSWSNTDQLYPIPQVELSRNPNLRPQTIGY